MKRLIRILISLVIIVVVFMQSGTTSVESVYSDRNKDASLDTQIREGVTSIYKSVDKEIANPGDTLTYTISDIGYSGEDLLSDVSVMDQIPEGLTYVPGSARPAAIEDNGILTWNIGDNESGIPGQISGGGSGITICSPASTGSIVSSSSNTITFSHTLGFCDNWLLLVGISFNSSSARTVTSVTYGGRSLSLVGTVYNGNTRRVAIFSLSAAIAGSDVPLSADVVVTFSGSSVAATAGVVTFSGVDQTTPLGSFASATGSGVTPSVTLSTTSYDLIFDTVTTANSSSGFFYLGENQNLLWYSQDSASIRGAASTELATSETVTMSWLASNSNSWAIGAVPIKPASTSPATRTTTVTAYPTLVSSGNSFTLKAVITNAEADSEITPGIPSSINTGEASISCGSPTPANGSIAAGGSVEFTWICTATADPNNFGSVALSVDANDGYYATGTSNTVLVVPALTYQTTINSDSGVMQIVNTATLQGNGGITTTSSSAITDIPVIGDLVWEDEGDGVQEVGELGVAGVSVTLFSSTGLQINQVLTDANGNYFFNDVSEGTYYLHFTLPDGYSFTHQNQGSDPGLDSDVDPETGKTALFTWNGTASDLTWDAGLKRNYVTKSDRTVTLDSDPQLVCCQEYLVSQAVSAAEPPGGITPAATMLTLMDTVADEFNIVPGSIMGCPSSIISEGGKVLTCNWDDQSVDTPTIITYQIRKASAGAIAASGSFPTHVNGSLQYTDHLGDRVMLDYGAGTTTAALSGADECQGDIEIEKTLMTSDVSAGSPVVFRLEVTNNSGFTLSGFEITDTLDPLLTFTSASPAICDYSGSEEESYGGTVTCISSSPLADQGIYQIDLTTLFKPGSEDFFGENTATVSCPWCIVDSDSDNSISPTAVTGVVDFQIMTVPDIRVRWETVDETSVMGFRLIRESEFDSGLMIYATDAYYQNQMNGTVYMFTDSSWLPGETYKYWLQVLWTDGTITQLSPLQVRSPYKSFFPFIKR